MKFWRRSATPRRRRSRYCWWATRTGSCIWSQCRECKVGRFYETHQEGSAMFHRIRGLVSLAGARPTLQFIAIIFIALAANSASAQNLDLNSGGQQLDILDELAGNKKSQDVIG